VLSPAAYNGRVGLALLCPITNQVKGYPFEVVLPSGGPVTGVILSDQVKSLDWRARCGAHHRLAARDYRRSVAEAGNAAFTIAQAVT
jgi:mRNA-degrading endonuclease toxin of MazEF toxin-antitoxin module